MVYNAAGNLISKTDANGATITFAYDAVNRLTEKFYPDGSRESYTYDAVGRLLGAMNASVSYSYGYDAVGRVTSVTDSRGYTIDYTYDTLGNRSTMTLLPGSADERVISYAYDCTGRITGITSNAGTFTYGYDSAGRRASLRYPNDIVTSYSYDSAGRLTNLAYPVVASFAYTHDRVGNRTSKTSTGTENYLYDSIYRLLTVASPRPEIFSYDAVGNCLAGPGAKDTGYLHNSAHQMTQGTKLSYRYDKNGNQTDKVVPGALEKSWTQSWDYENRLVNVEKVKGSERKTVTFSYDPMGRRIAKTLNHTKGNVTRTRSWSYVYDNENIIIEIQSESSGTTKTFFTHGPEVDEHLVMERNSQFRYYYADGLGNVVALTDRNKQVVQSYEYDSRGRIEAFWVTLLTAIHTREESGIRRLGCTITVPGTMTRWGGGSFQKTPSVLMEVT